jgi:hypothetical protein
MLAEFIEYRVGASEDVNDDILSHVESNKGNGPGNEGPVFYSRSQHFQVLVWGKMPRYGTLDHSYKETSKPNMNFTQSLRSHALQ